ncbi:hypothetical protein ACQPX6_01835 [Actinomycetospora sp. CA-101289]|uniref:hypothetical protein n=1 Tax=Actinomycetospora sp. CA-101289 TaxID=3239893 RepID=UPI003D9924D4
MIDDPVLLEWHLRARGYPTSSHEENKRRLYLLVRLEAHESNFLAWQQKLLNTETWAAWERLLRADTRIKEFRDVWPSARQLYVKSFAEEVDRLIVDDGNCHMVQIPLLASNALSEEPVAGDETAVTARRAAE